MRAERDRVRVLKMGGAEEGGEGRGRGRSGQIGPGMMVAVHAESQHPPPPEKTSLMTYGVDLLNVYY